MEQILLAQIITMMILKLVGVALTQTYGQKSLVWQCILLDVWQFFYSLALYIMKSLAKTHRKEVFQVF